MFKIVPYLLIIFFVATTMSSSSFGVWCTFRAVDAEDLTDVIQPCQVYELGSPVNFKYFIHSTDPRICALPAGSVLPGSALKGVASITPIGGEWLQGHTCKKPRYVEKGPSIYYAVPFACFPACGSGGKGPR